MASIYHFDEIEDITPKEFICGGGNCPSVFKASNNTFLIVGKIVNHTSFTDIVKNRVGPEEVLVEVPRNLILKARL